MEDREPNFSLYYLYILPYPPSCIFLPVPFGFTNKEKEIRNQMGWQVRENEREEERKGNRKIDSAWKSLFHSFSLLLTYGSLMDFHSHSCLTFWWKSIISSYYFHSLSSSFITILCWQAFHSLLSIFLSAKNGERHEEGERKERLWTGGIHPLSLLLTACPLLTAPSHAVPTFLGNPPPT